MIHITRTIAINESEIQLEFIRSPGPGGQNVNKVATSVQLRFNVSNAHSLPGYVRERLVQLAGKRITKDGVLIIEARRFRTQESNRQDAINRLVELIRKATEKPKPRTKTRPTRASKIRRLTTKRRRRETKHMRQSFFRLDD